MTLSKLWHVKSSWPVKSGHPAEVNQKQRHLPWRPLCARLPNRLVRLKPCWMRSPLAVSTSLKSPEFQFDVIIFDEASQVLPWDAIGAIGRDKSPNRKRHSHLVEMVHQSNRFPNSAWRFHVVSRPFRTSAGEKTLIPVKRAKSGVLNVTRVVTRCRCMAATNRAS